MAFDRGSFRLLLITSQWSCKEFHKSRNAVVCGTPASRQGLSVEGSCHSSPLSNSPPGIQSFQLETSQLSGERLNGCSGSFMTAWFENCVFVQPQAENMMDIGTRRIFNEDHDMFRENARKFFRDQLGEKNVINCACHFRTGFIFARTFLSTISRVHFHALTNATRHHEYSGGLSRLLSVPRVLVSLFWASFLLGKCPFWIWGGVLLSLFKSPL